MKNKRIGSPEAPPRVSEFAAPDVREFDPVGWSQSPGPHAPPPPPWQSHGPGASLEDRIACFASMIC